MAEDIKKDDQIFSTSHTYLNDFERPVSYSRNLNILTKSAKKTGIKSGKEKRIHR